jgi:hypothetical protein
MKTERKSHQRLQQLEMSGLQLGSQLVGMQKSRYVSYYLPAPPGRSKPLSAGLTANCETN